jgi:PAT family beta-lactamase induction signal transducer AmpG
MVETNRSTRSPWLWVPTLYTAEGLPYALVLAVSVVLYKNLGVSNAEITFYTGWLYLPWVIKPLWSPIVDVLKTRRQWIWATQFLTGTMLAAVSLAIPAPHFFQLTLALFWLLAFNSATHDIAADGFYMLATTEHDQSFFNGVRSLFYRVATILAQGELVSLAGKMHDQYGGFIPAWSLAFAVVAVIFLVSGLYHFWILPKPAADAPGNIAPAEGFFAGFFETFAIFFRKPGIFTMLAFLLLYRLGEAQLVRLVQPFLLDSRSQGGLGLTDGELGLIYGKSGIAALMLGGLLGGFVVARQGLKFWLWPMLLAIHLPDAVFIWLAWAQPTGLWAIGAGVAVEQFGYGFGFTAFMLYMIYIARGEHRTAHYAICTGFMALGMMLPGMWSGWLQEHLGYPHFFVWVLLATIPSFVAARLIQLDSNFGRKTH